MEPEDHLFCFLEVSPEPLEHEFIKKEEIIEAEYVSSFEAIDNTNNLKPEFE